MRLNKFLAQSGISSRRKADQLIQMATTTVNGEICLNPAYNVKPVDVIEYDNIKISVEKNKIVTLNDFAYLATFELTDKEEGIFKNLDIDEKVVDSLIKKAREKWFVEEEQEK